MIKANSISLIKVLPGIVRTFLNHLDLMGYVSKNSRGIPNKIFMKKLGTIKFSIINKPFFWDIIILSINERNCKQIFLVK